MANFDRGDRLKNTLGFQAMLYAGGQLDEEDAKAFEHRLADDQAAREALCQAMQVLEPVDVPSALRPDPGYRQKVRAQLLVTGCFWQRLFAVRAHRGHPLLWGLSGAALAFVLFAGFEAWQSKDSGGSAHVAVNEPSSAQTGMIDEYDTLAETADIWAAMHPSDHLLKAHDDEARRRNRAQERSRLMKYDERHNRSDEPSKPL
jgi:hypothetical protein